MNQDSGFGLLLKGKEKCDNFLFLQKKPEENSGKRDHRGVQAGGLRRLGKEPKSGDLAWSRWKEAEVPILPKWRKFSSSLVSLRGDRKVGRRGRLPKGSPIIRNTCKTRHELRQDAGFSGKHPRKRKPFSQVLTKLLLKRETHGEEEPSLRVRLAGREKKTRLAGNVRIVCSRREGI